MKIIKTIRYLFIIVLTASCTNQSATKNNEPKEEVSVEIPEVKQTLFDGSSMEGWKQYGSDTIGDGWSIVDGLLVASKDGLDGNNVGFGASLITENSYKNFELELEYKLTKTGNSGIIYHIKEDTAYNQDYETGIEFQLLDDENSIFETLPSHQTAGNYDMYAPLASKQLNGPNEWNAIRLIYNEGHVEHWLNGEKVLEYERGDDNWNERLAKSKWVDYPGWAQYEEGHIGLQNHGDAVWFRNIKISEL